MEHQYFVYIMTNPTNTVLYVGITNNLLRRVKEHKTHSISGFTDKYNAVKLVYFESTDYVHSALEREKQLKGWARKKKIALIESINPGWKDLSEGWYDEVPSLRSG